MNEKLRVTYYCQDKSRAPSTTAASSTTTAPTTSTHSSHRQAVQCCTRTKDGLTLFTGGRDTTIGVWRSDNDGNAVTPLTTLVGHDDWVNDALLVESDRVLVSASSDTALKLWLVAPLTERSAPKIGDSKNIVSATLHAHADYATAIAHARDARRLFSVGLDARCYVWKVRDAVQLLLRAADIDLPNADDAGAAAAPADVLPAEDFVKPCGVFSAPPVASLYAVATNGSGNAVVMGAADHIVRQWDPTALERNVTQLIGHTDVVRCVAIDAGAQFCLSGSTDCTVRLWDLRQRRCVRVFEHHDASVWSLSVDPRFETFVSGDRDGQLFHTDIASGQTRAIAPKSDSIVKRESVLSTSVRWQYDDGDENARRLRSLDIALCTWQHSLWNNKTTTSATTATAVEPPTVATTTTTVVATAATQPISCRLWQFDVESGLTRTQAVLPGRSGVRRCTLLPDRRHALSADDDGTVRLWDLCRAREVCSLDKAYPLEVIERALSRPASLRAWASVKPVGGRLAVVVDALQALQCRTYANEAGFAATRHKRAQQFAPTARVNVGERVLAALFRVWIDKAPEATVARLAFEQRREAAAKQAAAAAAAAVAAAEKSSKQRRGKQEANGDTAHGAAAAASGATATAAPSSPAVAQPPEQANGHSVEYATANDATYRIADNVQVVLSDRVTGATIRRATVQDLDSCGELAPWLTNLLVAEAALSQPPLPNVAFKLLAVDPTLPYKLKGARMSASPLCKMTRLVKFIMQSATIELPHKEALGGAYRKFKAAQRRAEQRERSFLRHIELGTIDKQFIDDCLSELDDDSKKPKAHRRRRHRTRASAADESSASSSESSNGGEVAASTTSAVAVAPAAAADVDLAATVEVPEHDNHVESVSELIDAADYLQILIGETVLPMGMDIATAKSLHWQEFERDVEFQFRVNPIWTNVGGSAQSSKNKQQK